VLVRGGHVPLVTFASFLYWGRDNDDRVRMRTGWTQGGETFMLKRSIKAACLLLAASALVAGSAAADKGGAGTETFTEHEHEVPFFSIPVVNECNGQAGTLELIAKNEIFHITTQADGDAWLTGTANGSGTFTPEEPGGVEYSGHFASWFGVAVNNKNNVEHSTFSIVLTGTDGSKLTIHVKGHLSTNGQGVVVVERPEVFSTHCG
jgi:hypothetical protein